MSKKTKTRIRVKEMKMVPASLLDPHPGNFRMHTPEQRSAMDGVLSEVGFAGAILVRELEGGRYQVLDGHLRVEEMAGQEVPILVTDLSEVEARKVLATFDAVGSMAEVDTDGLRALIEGIEWDNKEIEKIIAEALGEIVVPDFQPASIDEQGKLDQLQPKIITCPHCGNEFDSREQE
jgi:hypothetical protein